MQSDFALLFKRDCPLLDVRSPVEFAKGAFPASRNIPLLTDAQRAAVGTAYRRSGGEAATKLGHELVSGESRSVLIERWRNFIDHNPDARLYCFRGGQRSQIVRQWLREEGVEVPLVPGGYKALRGFLLHVLEQAAKREFLIIAGKTGSGKTRLLAGLPHTLDIEGAARHRGSAFGALPVPQPSQIDFENAMAVALLKLEFETAPVLIVEDESRAVGSLAIPPRAVRTHAAGAARAHRGKPGNAGGNDSARLHSFQSVRLGRPQPRPGRRHTRKSLRANLEKIRRRLGDSGFRKTDALMQQAFAAENGDGIAWHRQWIGYLLENYYDPMYQYQLAHKLPRVHCRGSREEITQSCLSYISSSAIA